MSMYTRPADYWVFCKDHENQNISSIWTFTKPLNGVNAVNNSQFITLGQANSLYSGNSSIWGNITGTLSNQTDLSTALSGKQPLLGFTPYNATNPSGYLSSVGIANLTATGTPSSSTYLRGDNTWATVSGGGAPGGSNTQIQYNNSSAFGGASDFIYNSGTSSVYKNVTTSQTTWAGRVTFLGDSITEGSASTGTGTDFASLVCSALGLTKNNQGVNGMTLISNSISPGSLSGGGSLLDNIAAHAPTYDSGVDAFLCICIGTNDLTVYYTNWSSAAFQTAYTSLLSSLHTTYLWPFNKIVLCTLPYIADSAFIQYFGSPGGCSVLDRTRIDAFNTVIRNTAVANTTMLADIDAVTTLSGAAALKANNLHPTNEGHRIMTTEILNGVRYPVQTNSQAIAANGPVEFNQLKLKEFPTLSPTTSYMLGIDSSGNVGIVDGIKTNTRAYGAFLLSGDSINGALTYENPILPSSGLSANDYILPIDGKIYGITAPTHYNYIKFNDISGNLTLFTNGFGIIISDTVATHKWSNGCLAMGSGGNISSFSQTGDIYIPVGSGIEAINSGGYGRITPIDISANTTYRNSYSNGEHLFYNSGGVNASQQLTMAMFSSSNIAIGSPTDDTINKLQVSGSIGITSTQTSVNGSTSGSAKFQQDYRGSQLKIVIIKCVALIGTASYTFPTAFTTTPSVVGSDDVSSSVVTSKSTSAVTITGTTTSGTLMLVGY